MLQIIGEGLWIWHTREANKYTAAIKQDDKAVWLSGRAEQRLKQLINLANMIFHTPYEITFPAAIGPNPFTYPPVSLARLGNRILASVRLTLPEETEEGRYLTHVTLGKSAN